MIKQSWIHVSRGVSLAYEFALKMRQGLPWSALQIFCYKAMRRVVTMQAQESAWAAQVNERKKVRGRVAWVTYVSSSWM